MKLNDFIFLNKPPLRYARHILFWTLWWCYFYGCRYFYPTFLFPSQRAISLIRQDNLNHVVRPYNDYWETAHIWGTTEFIRSLLMLCVHIAGCYAVIYFLLPILLLKSKYFFFLSANLLLVLVMILLSRFVDTVVMHGIIGNWNAERIPYYSSIFEGVINAIKIIAVAVAIKLGKYWLAKQKEKETLEREKIDAEIQLLKAQLHPQFLFGTLGNIYSFALTASPKAPQMLLKLSDILSYMLYNCNEAEVSLNKEIKMLVEYMSLEKLRYGDKMEMNVEVTGDHHDDKIAPFLLLRFIQNSFHQSSSNTIEQAWINLEFNVTDHVLEMKLLNGKTLQNPECSVAEKDGEDDIFLARRLLELLYPNRYLLKITEESEITIVTLTLQLTTSMQIATHFNSVEDNMKEISSVSKY